MTEGIIIGEDNIKGKILLDSRKSRPQIAIGRSPKHFDILLQPAPTALQVFAVGPNKAEETILTIAHNLGYVPYCLVYFYLPDTGSYAVGKLYYGFGNIDDYLRYTCDTKNFYVIHTLEDYLAGSDYTSTAPSSGKVRIKYLIFSNPLGALTNSGVDS